MTLTPKERGKMGGLKTKGKFKTEEEIKKYYSDNAKKALKIRWSKKEKP